MLTVHAVSDGPFNFILHRTVHGILLSIQILCSDLRGQSLQTV